MAQHEVFNELERRIVIAMQIDGRATWRKIARVLHEPERTVARYGQALLESGRVSVAAIAHRSGSLVASFTCAPGTVRVACEALAQRPDTSFSYMVTGQSDAVTELHYDGDLAEILTMQLPATPGVNSLAVYPILKYFKTIRAWRAEPVSEAQERALTPATGGELTEWNPAPGLTENDSMIIEVLRKDGRASIDAISRQVKMSESSVSRRVDWLLRGEQISIRTLVEPALLGFPVEALLWVQTSPHSVEALGQRLRLLPEVRYAAAVAGDAQLIVDVTVRTQKDLYRFISDTEWGEMVQIKTAMVLSARKRGGRLFAV
ncbi:ArsR family transcriptional regulator [Glutamicibacter sp. BW80]|uniref:Lrp/AsnC family transcriptional regulator n=1 Tax=unclassified Glutamicibacter TaxID=2627139 RepID=UPI000BB83EE1|nr:AsnC family transcriptional regulator [Glutamicibacter sp. BW80]PCC28408.1 ArsR family transcriptional regulator [Glutamicibacter sp. BW80]